MTAEEVTLETPELTDFLRLVEDWRNCCDVGEHAVYRGHTDYNWIIIAKLFRDPDAKPENNLGDDPQQVEAQLIKEHLRMKEAHNLEFRLLSDFSLYLYAHRPDLVCTVPENEKSSTRAMQECSQLAITSWIPLSFHNISTNASGHRGASSCVNPGARNNLGSCTKTLRRKI